MSQYLNVLNIGAHPPNQSGGLPGDNINRWNYSGTQRERWHAFGGGQMVHGSINEVNHTIPPEPKEESRCQDSWFIYSCERQDLG